eukprot:54588-Prorocentrum_minimum.AAC.1
MAGVEAVFRPSARGAEQLVRGLPGAPGSAAGGATYANAWTTQLQKQHNATIKPQMGNHRGVWSSIVWERGDNAGIPMGRTNISCPVLG